MRDARTGFATSSIPPEPALGQVRRFPVVAGVDAFEDEGDRVLVRRAGRNVVYDTPAHLTAAIRAADAAADRAQAIRDFHRIPRWARLHFDLAALPAEILIGVPVGLPFAALFAKVLLS